MTDRTGVLAAVALAAVLIGSAILMPVIPGGVPSAGEDSTPTPTPKSGEVYEPNAQTDERDRDSPDDLSQVPTSRIEPMSNDEGGDSPPAPESVRASAGTQTMQIDTTTVDGEPALVLNDDRTHDGRWVSVSTEWLQEVHGDVPSTVTIEHESGDVYSESVRVRGDSAAFYVRSFSQNTVTFSGELKINADPADDGSQYSYDIEDLDAASDVSVNLTGVNNTETHSSTYTGSTSDTFSVAGNAPANTTLEITGQTTTSPENVTGAGVESGHSETFSVGGNADPTNDQVSASGSRKDVLSDSHNGYSIEPGQSQTEEVYVGDIDQLDVMEVDGYQSWPENPALDVTVTVEGVNMGTHEFTSDEVHSYSSNTVNVSGIEYATVKIDVTSVDGSGDGQWYSRPTNDRYIRSYSTTPSDITISLDSGDSVNLGTGGEQSIDVTQSTSEVDVAFSADGKVDYTLDWTEVTQTRDPNLSVGDETLSHSGVLEDGETVTKNVTLAPGTHDVTVNTDGPAASEVEWTETTVTHDIGVVLNGDSVSVDGRLEHGETAQRTINESALKTGTNIVNVSVGDGSLSDDAPDPRVRMELSHDAADRQSVDYTAEEWTSRYNLSKSYASARSNATLTIPFDSDNVLAMRNVEMRVNESGEWTAMDQSEYSLDGTELTANLSDAYGGTIPEGSTVEVRANASKVDPINGSITVVEPTPAGEDLDSKIRIDEKGANFRVETAGERVHYAHNASYDPEDYWVVDQQGEGQRLHLPGAQTGDTVRVSTMPVKADPIEGDAHITVVNTSASGPTISVEPGSSSDDEVAYTFLEAQDGTEYDLYSETHQIVRDSGTAESPLTLTDDDSNEVLTFLISDGATSGSSGGDDGGSGLPMAPQQGTDWPPLIAIALTLAGLVVASRNSETVTNAGSEAADGVEGAFEGIPVVGPALGSILSGIIQGVAQLARAVVENRTIAVALIGAVAWGAIQGGIIALPEGSTIIVLVAAISVLSAVALREAGEWDPTVWAGINVVTAATAAIIFSDADPVAAITSSEVMPAIAIGVLYLAYRAIQAGREAASTPEETNRIVIDAGQGDD